MNKQTLLIFGAHPDDAEIGMGATIAKHAAAGDTIILCDLTKAELSSNGTVETRQNEAERAGNILGVKRRISLDLPDRGLFLSDNTIRLATKVIRQEQPDIVCAPYSIDRHPDHVACHQIVKEAVFNSKIHKYTTSGHEPAHPVNQAYSYFINDWSPASFILDVTPWHKLKMEALQAYASQFMTTGETVQTILNQGYIEMVLARDRWVGQMIQSTYGEGFISLQPMTLGYLGRAR